jgi:adenylate cyclase
MGLVWTDGGMSDARRTRWAGLLEAVRRTDSTPGLLGAARAARELLPGDSAFGDPLSTAGDDPRLLLARRLAQRRGDRDSVARELGLSAFQVWQALSERQGRGRGEQELAILFTDLVEFSAWALEAGDETALELLRQVGLVQEPPIGAHGGRVVKRLGDGLMAVFASPAAALEATHEAFEGLSGIELAGYRPRLRAGIHVGRPRKLGGDYLGVDVNIAARVAQAASGGEVLVSDAAAARLDENGFVLRRQRRFKAKGAPRDLAVYLAEPA